MRDSCIDSYLMVFLFLLKLISGISFGVADSSQSNDLKKSPTVFTVIFTRNKAVVLPYFLTLLTRIEYPKDRMRIRVYYDPSDDESVSVIELWMKVWSSQYLSINLTAANTADTNLTENIRMTSETEFPCSEVIRLREEALEIARISWADYIWFLDCDALLTDPRTLNTLLRHELEVTAPMLLSDDMYSNFWCGMTPSYSYKRTDEYIEILYRKKVGCFVVPVVNSAVLVSLRSYTSDKLTFNPGKMVDYDGPVDDMITFAVSAIKSGIPLHICNDIKYGYITIPPGGTATMKDYENNLLNLKLHITVDDRPLNVDDLFSTSVSLPPKTKLGFDEIFVINLERRTERKARMKYCLDQLGIDAKFVNAVDGRLLENADLHRMRIAMMTNYEDPYHKRPMKKGEIACFLSHYNIWREVIDNNLSEVLILEDDVRFGMNFVRKMKHLIHEMHRFPSQWNLIYIGRKIMRPDEESYLDGSDFLVCPYYTYWTIGYVLNREGAEKLVNAEPLSRLLPVDEFLPIMYDKHPREDWKMYFPTRNLKALSVNPLIVYPVKYTHEEGYVSDTEDSFIIEEKTTKFDEL